MKATIVVEDPQIEKLLQAEQKTLINDRASFVVVKTDKKTRITVTAKDAVSLRATLNSICKQLTIYEKMRSL